MRKEDLSKAIGGIDPKLVESSMAYRPATSKHRLIKIVALAACLAVIVTAIPLALILNRESEDANAPVITTPSNNVIKEPDNGENKLFQNVIYCEADLAVNDELIKNAFHNQEVVIKNSHEFEDYHLVYIGGDEKPTSLENIPETLNFSVSGLDISATLETAYYDPSIIDETLKNNGMVAKYLIDTINSETTTRYLGHGEVYYSIENKEILGFVARTIPSYSGTELTEEALWKIVEKDTINLYGEKFLSQYSHKKVYSSYKEGKGWSYNVTFFREIGGIRAYEKVDLEYNGDGQLRSIFSYNLNAFDSVESKITKGLLDEVDKIALKILDGRLVYSKYLKIDTEGEVYVYYQYINEDDEVNELGRIYGNFYIKVGI